MEKIITKIINKYFKYLFKKKWLKLMLEKPIDDQKKLLEIIDNEIEKVTEEILSQIECNIEFTESLIDDEIKEFIFNMEHKQTDDWRVDND